MSSIFIPENLYPDCGTMFKEELEGTQVVKKVIRFTNSGSISKKSCRRGRRHGFTAAAKAYFDAYSAWKKNRKNKDKDNKLYSKNYDRFIQDDVYRASQEVTEWDDQECLHKKIIIMMPSRTNERDIKINRDSLRPLMEEVIPSRR